ncbi:MAG: GIY-YIG nuclease family protein [Saprospiraceae bacterium]|nr:GIY-YIG nuclease family protein [Saprospiraceae bacterium]
MNFYVYIIYSTSRNIFYTGISTNPIKRLQYHNNAKDGFTSHGRPWQLLWSTYIGSRSDAEALEKKIKNLSQQRKIHFMKKYHDGIYDAELFNSLKS